MTRRPRVYIAGPMNPKHGGGAIEYLRNCHRMIELARELIKNGFAPFCPAVDMAYFLGGMDDETPTAEEIKSYSMAWIPVCEAVITTIGWTHSGGALAELDEAARLGIPHFKNIGRTGPMGNDYADFLSRKAQLGESQGFDPTWIPDFLFDFQKHLTEWAIRKGRAAIFADCGLGKTPMQLVWAENVVRKTNKPVLILTPLAVSAQTIREAKKFDIDCRRSAGDVPAGARVVVTNYEKLHHFNRDDFGGAVCDESSAIKAFDGKRRAEVTEFMRHLPYRLLCTATAAPNDYIELGTASEALGEMGQLDMLSRFFVNDQGHALADGRSGFQRHMAARVMNQQRWRFKGHAEDAFWKWI
jgi:hypothetical protein